MAGRCRPNPDRYPASSPTAPRRGSPTGASPSASARPFREACDEIADLPDGIEAAAELDWFPERAWGGRVWVPCSTRAEGPEGRSSCSATSPTPSREEGDPADFRAKADFTDVLAEDNADWRIDLNDDVIGRWRGENGRAGDVTLVWGRPLLQGAVAATAELDNDTVDQESVSNGRFTLIALDALEGYGDDIFMQVKLWSKRAKELASESLYD